MAKKAKRAKARGGGRKAIKKVRINERAERVEMPKEPEEAKPLKPTVPGTTADKRCASRYPKKPSIRCEGKRYHEDDHFAHRAPKKTGDGPTKLTWRNTDKKQQLDAIIARAREPSTAAANARCSSCKELITHHKPDCVTVNARIGTSDSAPPTKDMVEARQLARVCKDSGSRTCIELRRASLKEGESVRKVVRCIPLSEGGFVVETVGAYEFDHKFKEIVGYPVERCARLYAGYSQHLGASHEAMDELAKLVPVTEQQKEKAMAKKPSISTASKKPGTKSTLTAKRGEPRASKEPRERKESAADMFRTLIMEGKLTDDAIFSAVKKKHGLDDSKRNYVAWYRNQLKKDGKKPPAAKESSKKAA